MPLRFLCESRETGGAWSLFEEEVPLGMGPPPHRHDWDEAYYVLEGEIDFEVDGEPMKSKAGDFNYLPRNTVHCFKGASASPSRVLIFATPAHGSEFFQELNDEVRSIPDDLAKIPDIGQRHGIEFVPAQSEAR
jgi:quercetin dioxygenase-like cupin family protein